MAFVCASEWRISTSNTSVGDDGAGGGGGGKGGERPGRGRGSNGVYGGMKGTKWELEAADGLKEAGADFVRWLAGGLNEEKKN
jgi:hypothetical protein